MKTDFDDYGSKYCIKSLKEDPSHEYCLNPNRISRYCSHSYKQNMNTISHYLKKLSKKDDYDLETTMRISNDEKQFENLRDGVELNYSVWLKNHGRRSAYVSLSIENRFELSERVPKDSVQEVEYLYKCDVSSFNSRSPTYCSIQMRFFSSKYPILSLSVFCFITVVDHCMSSSKRL